MSLIDGTKYYPAPYAAETGSGERVHLNTGHLSLSMPIVSLKGRGGLDFGLSVVYNSNKAYRYDAYVTNSVYVYALKSRSTGQIVEIHGECGNGYPNDWFWRSNYDIITNYCLQEAIPTRTQNAGDAVFSRQHGLGLGWMLGITSIECGRMGTSKYIHFASGGSCEVDDTTNALKNHPVRDVEFVADASFANSQGFISTHAVKYKDGRREFFRCSGNINTPLGISDRFGNRIDFQTAVIDGYPRITGITDSAGRQTTISYTAALVTFALPGGRTVRLALDNSNGYPVLTSHTDALGRTTSFNYEEKAHFLDYVHKTAVHGEDAHPEMNQPYAMLGSVTRFTGAVTRYAYEEIKGHLGTHGMMTESRIISRLDEAGGRTYNARSYAYTGSYLGDYYALAVVSPEELPAGYTYSVTVTDAQGVAAKTTFDVKGLAKVGETRTANSLLLSVVNSEYDANRQETRRAVSRYNAAEHSPRPWSTLSVMYTATCCRTTARSREERTITTK